MKSLIKLLDDPEFTQQVPHATESYAAGTVILEEDDEGRDFYLIVKGQAQAKIYIEDKIGGLTTGLTKLGANDLFGELSMFDGEPRSAQVTAVTDCEVIHFDGIQMIDYLDAHPEKGYWILKEMLMHVIVHMRQNTIRAKTALQLYLTETT
ncbi:MAG: cyclic nucleotide-binding domain-containing protein [Candidatus Methylumidiphilus sp.]